MALILANPLPALASATYLRIDGVCFEAIPQSRADGIWSVDPETPARFHVYAYHSIAARMAGAPPVADRTCVTTLAALGLLETVAGSGNLRLGPAWRARVVDTSTLWCMLYQHLSQLYPCSGDDFEYRSPDRPT